MEEKRDSEFYDDEIDLMAILSVIYRRKWLILIIMIISAAFVTGWTMYTRRDSSEAIVQLNFSGIEKHQYPDGSLFTMYDIIAPDIISSAAVSLKNQDHKKIFIENPRRFISINPFVPYEIKAKIETMKKQNKTFIYLPNQFYLRFTQAEFGGEIFSSEEKNALLIGIIEAYKAKFNKLYLEKPLVNVEYLNDSLNGKDYSDTVTLLTACIDSASGFLESIIKEAGYYKSPKTGMSFVDLQASLKTLKNIDLDQAKSIIKMFHLTKNKEDLISKYNYMLQEFEKERQKKEKEADVARSLLKEVWQKGGKSYISKEFKGSNPSGIMLDSDLLNKLSDKDIVSLLLKSALNAEVKAKKLAIDRNFLQKDLSKLIEKKKIKKEAIDAAKADIEKRLNRIENDIKTIGNNVNELNREYQRNIYSNILQVIKYPEASFLYKFQPKMAIFLSLVMSLFVGIFIAFLVEYFQNHRKIINA